MGDFVPGVRVRVRVRVMVRVEFSVRDRVRDRVRRSHYRRDLVPQIAS